MLLQFTVRNQIIRNRIRENKESETLICACFGRLTSFFVFHDFFCDFIRLYGCTPAEYRQRNASDVSPDKKETVSTYQEILSDTKSVKVLRKIWNSINARK